MYLPKHQYTKPAIDFLEKFDLFDKLGTFITSIPKGMVTTAAGEVYIVSSLDLASGIFTNAEKITVIKKNEEAILGTPVDAGAPDKRIEIKTRRVPTVKELAKGVIERCFLRNTSTGKVVELTRQSSAKKRNSLKSFEKLECIPWSIEGPIEDKVINGRVLIGAKTKNKEYIEALEKKIPGVSNIVTNYSESVEDTHTNIPNYKDTSKAKGLNVGISIPSPSKSL